MSSSPLPLSPDKFPFDVIVITFPDQRAADAASASLQELHESLLLLFMGQQQQQQQHDRRLRRPRRILAATDPMGGRCRVGSGGGTIAALRVAAAAAEEEEKDSDDESTTRNEDDSVLIVHAGGESSRCPTQMVLGKAWTSLPSSSGGMTTTTPMHVWMQTCHQLFSNGLPPSSIVVVASDTLLNLPATTTSFFDWSSSSNVPPDAVVGLAVPAPLETAKNHGVYELDQTNQNLTQTTQDNDYFLAPCRQVLQKPSMEMLQTVAHPAATTTTETNNVPPPPTAWIDTGVIVFLPLAATALRSLAHHQLALCSDQGLTQLYQQQQSSVASLQDFAAQHAISVDLYTHMLQALKVSSSSSVAPADVSSSSKELYLSRQDKLSPAIAEALWKAFGTTCSLHILAAPNGRFLHLGTTRELLDFYTLGCNSSALQDNTNNNNTTTPTQPEPQNQNEQQKQQQRRQELCRFMGDRFHLVRRLQTFYGSGGGSTMHATAVLFHAALVVGQKGVLSVGPDSVIEHCYICAEGRIRISTGCFVSGLRPWSSSLVSSHNLIVPNGLMVQQVALSATVPSSSSSTFVYMVLGVDDPIKSSSSALFLGRSLSDFLEYMELTPGDLWGDKQTNETLWTAKLHPVVTTETFEDVYGWLQQYLEDDATTKTQERQSDSKSIWKSLPKLSLSEIRNQADATAELHFRKQLITSILPTLKTKQFQQIQESLLLLKSNTTTNSNPQQQQAIDFQFVIDTYRCHAERRRQQQKQQLCNTTTVASLPPPLCFNDVTTLTDLFGTVFCQAFESKRYDVCGRVCTVAAAFQDELARSWMKEDTSDDLDKFGQPSATSNRLDQLAFMVHGLCATDTTMLNAVKEMTLLVKEAMLDSTLYDETIHMKSAKVLDSIALTMTRHCVCTSQEQFSLQRPRVPPVTNQWVIATAPARIDLSGGWTDTPPICFEYGAAVTGIAVTVDGMKPLSCRCRIVPGSTGILLRTESRNHDNDGELLSTTETFLSSLEDIRDYCNPNANAALLKASLVCLGMVTPSDFHTPGSNLQSFLNKFCQQEESCRLEVVSTSLLPHGSGLGTSSILGGCVLAAIATCVGIDLRLRGHDYGSEGDNNGDGCDDDDMHELIHAVLILEQLLTTGGGFQDQVNGLLGGAKMVTCQSSTFPIHLQMDRFPLSDTTTESLNASLALIFTGKTRLAKGILQNVLRQWAIRSSDILETLERLVDGANNAKRAIQDGNMDGLGQALSTYWDQKKTMAGKSSGAEPPYVRDLIELLQSSSSETGSGLLRGASLCGAGGGGFMVVLLQKGVSHSDLLKRLAECPAVEDKPTLHDCKVSREGLTTKVIAEPLDPSSFRLEWHLVDGH